MTTTEQVDNPYISADLKPLNMAELRAFIVDNHLLQTEEKSEFDKRYWPGDKEERLL